MDIAFFKIDECFPLTGFCDFLGYEGVGKWGDGLIKAVS